MAIVTISSAFDVIREASTDNFVATPSPEPNKCYPLNDEILISLSDYSFTLPINVLLNNSNETREAKRNKKKGITKIPRPQNAFMIFRRDKAAAIKKLLLSQGKKKKSAEISKEIGEAWNSALKDVRDLFEAMAREAERIHLLKYPDYKYRPKSPKQTKRKCDDFEQQEEVNVEWNNEIFVTTKYLPSPTMTTTTDTSFSSPSSSQSDSFYPSPNTNSTNSPLVDMSEYNNENVNSSTIEDINELDFRLDQLTYQVNMNADGIQFVPSWIDINMVDNGHEEEIPIYGIPSLNDIIMVDNGQLNEQYNQYNQYNQCNEYGQYNEQYNSQYISQDNEEGHENNKHDDEENNEEQQNNDQPLDYYVYGQQEDWRSELDQYINFN
jgi:hypothetical protein